MTRGGAVRLDLADRVLQDAVSAPSWPVHQQAEGRLHAPRGLVSAELVEHVASGEVEDLDAVPIGCWVRTDALVALRSPEGDYEARLHLLREAKDSVAASDVAQRTAPAHPRRCVGHWAM